MANEELTQRGYIVAGKLKGDPFGAFERLSLGSTTVKELLAAGLAAATPDNVDYPFKVYRPPQNPQRAKPDVVYIRHVQMQPVPAAVAEHKAPRKLKSDPDIRRAAEQALFEAAALGVSMGIVTDGTDARYIDIKQSLADREIAFMDEDRVITPGLLSELLAGDVGTPKDPKPLAESVWQMIWHATKAEPKECLLTFVEIFLLKFLSDNLQAKELPDAYRFNTLLAPTKDFEETYGRTAIEYYVDEVRPRIRNLFPPNSPAGDDALAGLFGLDEVRSPGSIINGFAFHRDSAKALSSFNRTFKEILDAFEDFGPLTSIDPEFKLRLYETFLRRSARQQRLGQFFTPRNVVRPMIKMARLSDLADGAVVLDPAAGVGGFVLEPLLFGDALPDNIAFKNGKVHRRVRTVGLDVDSDLHILAKANMLIHLAEALQRAETTLPALNTALADTFIQLNTNEALGSLEYPARDSVDVILTNPPYVTKGSAIYQQEIAEIKGTRNGVDLRDYYSGVGLGVESLFVRYIAGALAPGGEAYVIVPLGLLNRTAVGPKAKLLSECNVVASIELPRNTFFNTAQKTYILILAKRHSAVDDRPDVFCARARTIGESLDWKRLPAPDANDLDQIADAFVAFQRNGVVPADVRSLVKLVPAEEFDADSRWDVARFWTDEEMVALGMREPPITRIQFIDEISSSIEVVTQDLSDASKELAELTAVPMVKVALSDTTLFRVRAGKRIRDSDIREHPGDVPVISCFKSAEIVKGYIDPAWLARRGIEVESQPVITVNANGASIGKVFVRPAGCVLTDDVIVVEPVGDGLDLEFLASQLRSAILAGEFVYEAKLFVGRVRGLKIEVPKTSQVGNFDLTQQRRIASAVKRFDAIRQRLAEIGDRSLQARIADVVSSDG